MKIGVIGEVLWDVVGQTELLGGASFNFAAHAGILGHEVSFVSGVGADERGARILRRMEEMHLSTRYVARVAGQPTGYVTVSVDSGGQPSYILHRPVAYHFPALGPEEFAAVTAPAPEWIYYGTLTFMSEQAKALAWRMLEAAPGARRFYDVNLRNNCYTAELLDELMSRASIVKLNDFEIDEVAHIFRHPNLTFENFARAYAKKYSWQGVCITRGAEGCAVLLDGEYFESPGFRVKVADAIGAGDAFAAAFVHGLSAGWRPARVAEFANSVGALIASRPGAIPEWSPMELPPMP